MTQDDAQDHDADVEDMAAELEEQGADPDAVAAFLEASLGDDDEDPEPPLTLWPENEDAFRVFVHCNWEREAISTMEKADVIYTGIAASEVHHVCQMLAIPSDRWPSVLAGVRVAVDAAQPLLNARD